MLDKTFLSKELCGVDIIIKEDTVSTNNDAKMLAKDSPCDTLIVADRQSGGRGRQGKSFISPSGGLYMTLLLRCDIPITSAVRATSCSAVALIRALYRSCGIKCGIKWVNDIYADEKKLCGILTEAVNDYSCGICRYLAIGVGVNISECPITDSSVKTVSLSSLGCRVRRDVLCAEIAKELILLRDGGFDFPLVADEYRKASAVLGKEISYTKNGLSFVGRATDITDSGGLIVLCDGKETVLDSGEISVRISE